MQPYTVAENLHYFSQASGASQSTHLFTWQPSKVIFQSLKGSNAVTTDSASVIQQWTYPGTIPKPGGEKVHINLWLVEGLTPKNGQEAELIVRKFEFVSSSQ